MLTLAKMGTDSPVPIKTIAQEKNLSTDFLEQIFFRLRKAGVIRSVRGPSGGFCLARPLSEISFLDILEASGERIAITDRDAKSTEQVWVEMDDQIRRFAKAKTLESMVRDMHRKDRATGREGRPATARQRAEGRQARAR